MIAKHCYGDTSLRMRKLHGHKENAAALLLAVCVMRGMHSNGFTCHNVTCPASPTYYKLSLLFKFSQQNVMLIPLMHMNSWYPTHLTPLDLITLIISDKPHIL
jgi:hypothetical protein